MASGSLRLGRNTVIVVVVVVVVVEEAFQFRSGVLWLNDLVYPRSNPFDLHVIVVGYYEDRELRRRQEVLSYRMFDHDVSCSFWYSITMSDLHLL